MRRWYPPVAIALAVQVATSTADMAVPVLGPLITADAGVRAASVGYYTSAVAVGAVAFYLFGSGVVRRLGALGALRAGAVVCAAALMLVLLGNWWIAILAGLLVGVGFGANTPASAVLLHAAVPRDRLHFAFSIKQTGMPIGTMLAGLCLPALAALWSWKVAILTASGACVLVALLVQGRGNGPGTPPPGPAKPAGAPEWSTLIGLAGRGPMPRLIAAGALLGMAQGSISAFLVTYLVEALDLSLVAAGRLYAFMHLAGIAGRLYSGWFADRSGLHARMLAVIGLLSAAMIVALASLSPDVPILFVVVVIGGLGSVIGSWNGILLAQVTGAAPADRVAEANSVAAIGVFGGFATGPVLFTLVVSMTGSFTPALLCLGTAAVLSALVLPWRSRILDRR